MDLPAKGPHTRPSPPQGLRTQWGVPVSLRGSSRFPPGGVDRATSESSSRSGSFHSPVVLKSIFAVFPLQRRCRSPESPPCETQLLLLGLAELTLGFLLHALHGKQRLPQPADTVHGRGAPARAGYPHLRSSGAGGKRV